MSEGLSGYHERREDIRPDLGEFLEGQLGRPVTDDEIREFQILAELGELPDAMRMKYDGNDEQGEIL